MSNDTRSLHHDLRGALSAIQMTLQTLEAFERAGPNVTPEKRLAVIERGLSALAEAVKLADRLKAEDHDTEAGCS